MIEWRSEVKKKLFEFYQLIQLYGYNERRIQCVWRSGKSEIERVEKFCYGNRINFSPAQTTNQGGNGQSFQSSSSIL